MRSTTTRKAEIGADLKTAAAWIAVPAKMKAAVLYGSKDLRVEQVDVPALAGDEVLLRVRLALTDGTDLKVWKRGYHAKMIQTPAVFGHEVVGEIAAVGKRVDARWQIGMRVVAANSAPCLRCFHCRRGQENLCEDLLFNNGAYAEYMRIPGRIAKENMLEVPHSVDDASAALAEPLACVLRGIHDNEGRMQAVGYPVNRYKLLAFVIGGTVAGVAGSLYTQLVGSITPDAFLWTTSGEALLMVIIGGTGTLAGSVLGAAAFILLQSLVSSYTERWMLLLGVTFIVLVLFAPGGVVGALRGRIGIRA